MILSYYEPGFYVNLTILMSTSSEENRSLGAELIWPNMAIGKNVMF